MPSSLQSHKIKSRSLEQKVQKQIKTSMTIRIKKFSLPINFQNFKNKLHVAELTVMAVSAYFEIAFDSEHPLHSGSLNGFSFKFNFANVLEHAL